ncbi:sugar transferase [Leptospira interrogans]|uniref:Bacterial sugar transferase domain-containing protein n=2 Tax=Leptospira interrogans TaxID=173 RepID=Q8VTZ3_LEPIR|nr:sugar transferase [Leptospira interrogans]AAL49445.1 unknown [Leptospira interrogans]EKR28438.1 bacterial sugar transferase [Leptospira interrogans serovar Bataviae str. L1111]MCR8649464.1 glycosyl transferase [Leptospira interrogans serovar Bataviae]QOI38205.1 sugar transferase [Leptospira interrogans serovar Bataviae]QOI50338.1 sugar transferase [Leptospira interrogans serovar Bataviae]
MYVRRHSRIHEQILLSEIFQLLVGTILIVVITVIPRWGFEFWSHIDANSANTLIGVLASFVVITTSLRKLFNYPGSQSSAYILTSTAIIYSLMLSVYLVARLSYSIQGMILGAIVTLVWCYIGYFLGHRYRKQRFALIPFGEALNFPPLHGTEFVYLQKPDLEKQRFDGVVADLRSKELSPDWEKFLAKCTLSRIPVYHTKQIIESLTGRVKIDHLSENELGTLSPSIFYERTKRIMDFLAAVTLIPFISPVCVLVSVLIRLESKGPAFFLQKRMGFRGKPFTVIKFRTMSQNSKGRGFTEGENDPRITKIGKYLRKYRIDELPQILNVLLGDMSFIGPRPESMELSEWYEKDVPFFAYRHVVRPGISGWAQVEQGYAAEVDGMKLKLEYDFYYIRRFSLWLDILIFFKTLKTIFTGFGSR